MRFCPDSEEGQDGKEPEGDGVTAPEKESDAEPVPMSSSVTSTDSPLLENREVDVNEGGLSCESDANLQCQDTGLHQVSGGKTFKSNHWQSITKQAINHTNMAHS